MPNAMGFAKANRLFTLTPRVGLWATIRQWIGSSQPDNTGPGFWANPTRRFLTHLLYALGMGGFTYLELSTTSSGLRAIFEPNFLARYAIETGISFGLVWYLMDNWLLRLLPGWKALASRALIRFWFGAGLALLIALVLQRTLVYWRIEDYYPRLLLFYETYPNARPDLASTFWFFARGWALVMLMLTAWSLMHRRAGRLKAWLASLSLGMPGAAIAREPSRTKSEATQFSEVVLHTPQGKKVLNPALITHATVEDHYCRIHLLDSPNGPELYIKMSLSKLLSILPPDRFVQIHRSHLVNLHHVSRALKAGRNYQLAVGPSAQRLPVSRHRLSDLKPHLQSVLGK